MLSKREDTVRGLIAKTLYGTREDDNGGPLDYHVPRLVFEALDRAGWLREKADNRWEIHPPRQPWLWYTVHDRGEKIAEFLSKGDAETFVSVLNQRDKREGE